MSTVSVTYLAYYCLNVLRIYHRVTYRAYVRTTNVSLHLCYSTRRQHTNYCSVVQNRRQLRHGSQQQTIITMVVGKQTSTHSPAGSPAAAASSACPAINIAADIAVLDSGEAVSALLILTFSTPGGYMAARVDTVDNVPGKSQGARLLWCTSWANTMATACSARCGSGVKQQVPGIFISRVPPLEDFYTLIR